MIRKVSADSGNAIFKYYKNAISIIDEATCLTKKYYDEVKKSTSGYRNYLCEEKLNSVPIEELKRYGSGIKITALKENGIEFIGQACRCSINTLVSYNGIGEASAIKITEACRKILNDYGREVKLRIDPSNPNYHARKLLRSIYAYIHCKPTQDLAVNTKKGLSPILSYMEEFRLGYFRGIWLFKPSVEKQRINDVYIKLVEIKNGDFGKCINDISTRTREIESISNDEIRKDFINNSVEYYTIIERIVPGFSRDTDENDIISKLSQIKVSYSADETETSENAQQLTISESYDDECQEYEKAGEINLLGLKCILRRYQENGLKYILKQKRVMLGDEMGLGKTVQAIATMVALRNSGASHFVVVCPVSVLTNWCREVEKHSDLAVIRVHISDYMRNAIEYWEKNGGVLVTTFESTLSIPTFTSRIDLMVVDEAHYIKNPEAKRSINTIRLSSVADRLLFMTGTPLENKVDEMVRLIHILQPNVAEKVKRLSFLPAAPEFRKAIAPVYLRRRREDVLTELPELIEIEEWCTMTTDDVETYEESLFSGSFMGVRRVSFNVNELSNSCKAKRMLELIEQAKEEDRKIIVYSYFIDTLNKICAFLGDICTPKIDGSVSANRRQEIIDNFEKASAGTVLPSQIVAGGIGLNIQAASVVIICEPQFKPSTEMQAVSRAYRMGQTRNVRVHRLLCENTIEDRMVARLNSKQREFDAFADKSVSGEKEIAITEAGFNSIVQEEIERIKKKKAV